MLVVISPAKKLDWSERPMAMTQPRFQDQAIELAELAKQLSQDELKALMKLSDKLAELNKSRFESFSRQPSDEETRAALFAFAGDTYQGVDASSLDEDERRYAQTHLQILSGLYGVLRPLDAIQPYRLEMGSRLQTPRGKSLYDYWGDQIAQALNSAAKDAGASHLINCASQEYFGAVDIDTLEIPVVTPVFMDDKGAGPKIISFHAKKARGAMARFIIQTRAQTPSAIEAFDTGGYRFSAERSKQERPVFIREHVA